MKDLLIVFDIDGTLILHGCEPVTPTVHAFFDQLGCYIELFNGLDKCYVLPGVYELMQHLLSIDGVKLAFFSTGVAERNLALVEALLIRALGAERYAQIASSVTVLSREHATPKQTLHKKDIYKQETRYRLSTPDSFGSDYKKDLRLALQQQHTLDRTILIDDCLESIYPGQERNILRTPPASSKHYSYFIDYALSAQTIRPSNQQHLPDASHSKLFCLVNTIYYVTGVLEYCMNKADSGNMLAQLFELQFNEISNRRYVPKLDSAGYRTQQFYDDGLRVLKAFNSQLCFNTTDSYLKHNIAEEQPVDSWSLSKLCSCFC